MGRWFDGDALIRQLGYCFVNHAVGGPPANEGNLGVFGPFQAGRGYGRRERRGTLRARFSTIMRRLCGLVNSSLRSVPSSSCSSVATT